jgi:subtilisin family serine protease
MVLLLTVGSRCQTVATHQPADPDHIADRLIVLYRTNAVPAAVPGARIVSSIPAWGIASVAAQSDSQQAGDPDLLQLQSRLASDPAIAYVVHDRRIHGSQLQIGQSASQFNNEASKMPETPDWYYTSSPQGWAVKQVGGFGNHAPGAPAGGPWDQSMGKGVSIAVLDSGISATHPDTASNLVYAQSLIDQTALPSPCDDGSTSDQEGHGTFVASLAAGALGRNTGMVVGVAPQASLLNIKILQRMPASGTGTQQALCEEGAPSGLMSWLISGIALASQQHADIISISAGSLLDSYSGEAEGLIAAINRAVYNATQAGSLVIAAAGNDGESLDDNRYIEMPAQAQDALAVVATTNPQCQQNLSTSATCRPGPLAIPYYSNYGATLQSVAAPGGSLPQDVSGVGVSGFVRGACSTGLVNTEDGLPSQPGHSFGCFNLGHASYVEAIGTSASAPLVAGVAAILKGAYPSLTPVQLAAALRGSTTAQPQSAAGASLNPVSAVAALASFGQ